jgi:ribosome-binding factor A
VPLKAFPGHKKTDMETTRQKKVSRLLQKELGQIIQHRSAELGGKLITVTIVRISPDLSVAKIYLSIFPPKEAGKTLAEIKKIVPQIRHELGNIVRNQLRIVPELAFFIDDSLDYIEKIETLLK